MENQNGQPQQQENNFYYTNTGPFDNYTANYSTGLSSSQENSVLRNDQMLFNAVNEDENENPFVQALTKENETIPATYNPYEMPQTYDEYTDSVNLLTAAVDAIENGQYGQSNFLKDDFNVGYNDQTEENMEISQIVPIQDFNVSQMSTPDGKPEKKKKKPKDPSLPKKKGRPPLNRDEHGKIIRDPNAPPPRKRPTKIKVLNKEGDPVEPPSKEKKIIPKMTKRVHEKKMNQEQIDGLKNSQKTFLQPGVCYKIAPTLDHCLECISLSTPKLRSKRDKKEVDCRFFEFRKLVYTPEGELSVHGFLDPFEDPAEVDHSIWLPSDKYNRTKLFTIHQCRLILTHVGDSFCEIIKKEQNYFQKYKQVDKPVIWKRLIWGVREICDLCSTTLFNHHFICTKCGFSCCIDCYEEHLEDETNFEFSCSRKKQKTHEFSDLHFTQTFTGDSMNEMLKTFHEICEIWDIKHKCELTAHVQLEDLTLRNFARNLIEEQKSTRTLMTKEIPDPIDLLDIDKDFFKSLRLEEEQKNLMTNENKDWMLDMMETEKNFQDNCEHQRKKYREPDYEKSLKYLSNDMEFVKNPSRIMCNTNSDYMYPGVRHSWMGNGKILRLMDPGNPLNDEIFHDQWQRGQPIIVSNILDRLNQDLWIPQAFSQEFGHLKSDLINCMNGNLVQNQPISVFWDGFETLGKRLLDKNGVQMLLKLKDWPPDEDFAKIMPDRFEDIMNGFPMTSYTTRNGEYNLVRYLPMTFVVPDLGPKMYNAYGSPFYQGKGTTNLHLDVSDAVNVMCYVGIPVDELDMDSYLESAYSAVCEAECDVATKKRMLEDGDIPGAIWHIYEANDSDKIRDLLVKAAEERGMKIESHHDPIHDQNWYLDSELRKRLFDEYGVKGYAFVQFLGDCVFIPAGTPHQVRNIFSCIKVAEDFVSPENISHCLHLSHEFRKLTKTHTNNEDKLQIKSVIYHSVKDVITFLNNLATKRFHFTVSQEKRNELAAKCETPVKKEQEFKEEMEVKVGPDMQMVPEIKMEPDIQIKPEIKEESI